MSNSAKSAVNWQIGVVAFLAFLSIFLVTELMGRNLSEKNHTYGNLQLKTQFCGPLKAEIEKYIESISERRESVQSDMKLLQGESALLYEEVKVWEGKSFAIQENAFVPLLEKVNLLKLGSERFFELSNQDDELINQWQQVAKGCQQSDSIIQTLEGFRTLNFEHLTTMADTLSLMSTQIEEQVAKYVTWGKEKRQIGTGDFDDLYELSEAFNEVSQLYEENQNYALTAVLN